MTDRLKDIRARLEAATPGPWSWKEVGDVEERVFWILRPGVLISAETDGTPGGDEIDRANASLIAHSPADIEYLLGIVEAAAAWKTARDAWLDVAADGSYCTGAANALSDARAALRKALEASYASTLKPTD